MDRLEECMIIGLKRGSLKLVSYDPEWEEYFNNEKKRLEEAIGQFVVTIEHVGSISIKNICAKPIIDIAIGLKKYDDGFNCIEQLEKIGYSYLGEHDIPGRHYFRTDSGVVKCHIHMHETTSKEWEDYLLFRDYLCNHEQQAVEYASLKKAYSSNLAIIERSIQKLKQNS
jgi:GrpB-like predicted nucleotidyltransferase (UPF0157 family)